MTAPDINTIAHRRGTVVIQTGDPIRNPSWKVFHDPVRVFETSLTDDVMTMLENVENEIRKGYHAAGFIAYEAASAFDPALKTRTGAQDFPLLWFGIYHDPLVFNALPEATSDACCLLNWIISQNEADYNRTIARLREHIRRGNTYQVNYTLRMTTDFMSEPWILFRKLCRAQNTCYCSYVRTDHHAICSVSPELFFEYAGGNITCRPMKGTAERGVNNAEDRMRADALAQSAKDRAENVMIVDMIRNDLGKIAVPGSVHTPELFRIERYNTVFQMTSTVQAKTERPFREVVRALFPCASVTGAPKVRTMRIIAEEETTPRGIYTGCIGYCAPPDNARFSVAIRTIQIDQRNGKAVYGTGGGIVWDSDAAAEYAECLAKAQVLFEPHRLFSLVETIRWERDSGYYLLDEHLERMRDSAEYFNVPFDEQAIRKLLQENAEPQREDRAIVRLLLDESGCPSIQTAKADTTLSSETWRVALAKRPIDERNRFLFHKTTNRTAYDTARRDFADFDDVILWNSRGEITEATKANIVLQKDGRFLTPHVRSGLLNGVFRQFLLARGQVEEAVLYSENIAVADVVYLINSVRGWIKAQVVTMSDSLNTATD